VSDIAAQDHQDNHPLAAMPPDAFALLEQDLNRTSLKQGAAIFEPDESIGTVYFPQTGLISLGLHTAFGRRLSFTRVIAQIGGTYSTIGAERFDCWSILCGSGQNGLARSLPSNNGSRRPFCPTSITQLAREGSPPPGFPPPMVGKPTAESWPWSRRSKCRSFGTGCRQLRQLAGVPTALTANISSVTARPCYGF
jgi:hypothetical protein